MNENHVYDMIIVGGGPGGYTSALYAARAGLETIVLEKLSAGGQMSLTWQIDNYPGFENGIDGFSLAEKMQKQAEKFTPIKYFNNTIKDAYKEIENAAADRLCSLLPEDFRKDISTGRAEKAVQDALPRQQCHQFQSNRQRHRTASCMETRAYA